MTQENDACRRAFEEKYNAAWDNKDYQLSIKGEIPTHWMPLPQPPKEGE